MRKLLIGLALLALLWSGCSAVSSLYDTNQALRNGGYQSVNVNVSTGDEVKVRVTVAAEPTDQDAVDVARTVWENFRERFAVVRIAVHGTGATVNRDFTHTELVNMFGPRNPAWDRTTIGSDIGRGVVLTAIVLAVILGSIVSIIVIIRRRRPPKMPWVPGGGFGSPPMPPPMPPPAQWPLWPPPAEPPGSEPPRSEPPPPGPRWPSPPSAVPPTDGE